MTKIDAKMESKWTQTTRNFVDVSRLHPWTPPKEPNGAKMTPKWSQNGVEMAQKWGGNSKENSRKTAGKAKEHLGKIQAKPKENRGKIKEDIQNHTIYPTITPTHPTQGFDIFTRRSNPKNRGGGFARMRSWI